MESNSPNETSLQVPFARRQVKSNSSRIPKLHSPFEDELPAFVNRYESPPSELIKSNVISMVVPPKASRSRKNSSKPKKESKKTQFPSVPVKLEITLSLGVIYIPQRETKENHLKLIEELDLVKDKLVFKENQLEELRKELNYHLDKQRNHESRRSPEYSSTFNHSRTTSNKIENFNSIELSELIKNRQLWLYSVEREASYQSKMTRYLNSSNSGVKRNDQRVIKSVFSDRSKQFKSRKRNIYF